MNVEIQTPPDSVPIFYRVRLWFWASVVFNEHRAATLRWRYRNAKLPHRCQCGALGTVRVGTDHGFAGSTPPYWWRCDMHRSVPLTVPWMNDAPLVNQSPETCSWTRSNISTGLIVECGCGTHIGEMLTTSTGDGPQNMEER